MTHFDTMLYKKASLTFDITVIAYSLTKLYIIIYEASSASNNWSVVPRGT